MYIDPTGHVGTLNYFIPGVNDDLNRFTNMILTLKNEDNFVSAGTIITNRDTGKISVNLNDGIDQRVAKLARVSEEEVKNWTPQQKVDVLYKNDLNVMFRVQFSSSTETHRNQEKELSTMIDMTAPNDTKVNLIAHSKGGLVSLLYADEHKTKVNKIITINTPFMPNLYAKTANNNIQFAKHFGNASEIKNTVEFNSLGKEWDYNKTGGYADLAGETGALEYIKKTWNEGKNDGSLSGVKLYVFASNNIRYDEQVEIFGYKLGLKIEGDGIVSLQSQLGQGLEGITDSHTEQSNLRKLGVNDLAWWHMEVPKRTKTAIYVKSVILNER